MQIELGRVEMLARLDKFVSVYSRTIAGLNVKVSYADLRYPNGFAVRRPEALTPVANKAKSVAGAKLSSPHLANTKSNKPQPSPASSGGVIQHKLSIVKT